MHFYAASPWLCIQTAAFQSPYPTPFSGRSPIVYTDEFIARSPDELSLAKGDRIELIERDDDFGDGWFLGKHLQNGNTGLFPEGNESSTPLLPRLICPD